MQILLIPQFIFYCVHEIEEILGCEILQIYQQVQENNAFQPTVNLSTFRQQTFETFVSVVRFSD